MLNKTLTNEDILKYQSFLTKNLELLKEYSKEIEQYYFFINVSNNIGKVNFLFDLKISQIIFAFEPEQPFWNFFYPLENLALLTLEFDLDKKYINENISLTPIKKHNNFAYNLKIIKEVIQQYNVYL